MIDRDCSELLRLSVDERLALIEMLWDSIVAESGVPPLTPEQAAEVERRIAEHERDPSTAIPWEVVRELLRKKFSSHPERSGSDPKDLLDAERRR